MSGETADWLMTTGRGDRPTLRWSFTVDAPITDFRLARETGDIVAADVSGGLYLIDRRGQVRALTRTRHSIKRLAWADDGSGGAAIVDGRYLGWFDKHLQFQWMRDLPDEALAIGVDPYGCHVCVGLANGENVIYTRGNKKVSRFESVRPLKHIQFLTNKPELLVASEYGFIGRFALNGQMIWTEKLWSTVGDLTATGDGKSFFLAGFAQGVQAFDGQTGNTRGTFVCDGTVGLVSCGYVKRTIVGYTLEGTLFSVDDSGNPKWNVTVPEDVLRVTLSPLCDFLICGLNSGRILRCDLYS